MSDNYIDITCSGTIKSKFTAEDIHKKITSYLKRNKNKATYKNGAITVPEAFESLL